MGTLDRSLRRELEKAVSEARSRAHAGAEQALAQLAVAEPEAWPTLSDEQKALRRRLRAHARQLGDRLTGERARCERLAAECAYEHWHRLLFARFLAENDLLIEPESGVALALAEVQELARERGRDWISLASEFAQSMLPQIFRRDDPVLAVALPPEARQALERILGQLPREVFLADDSLGWVYQHWQAETKREVNESERKIGAEELPAVTQLFTEDYMVLFLLENTLGAWWASRLLAAHPEIAEAAADEAALREATSPPGYAWTYLRFVRDDGGRWRAAAGDFSGWPERASELRVLDPCMGSGHFLVFALPILAAFRRAEEGLSLADAASAVLRDNLFGLELDARCTQLAAFNLALTAWRMGGQRALPRLHLACSGQGVHAKREEWLALASDDTKLRAGMERLHRLFTDAPTLGSLIDPGALGGDLVEASSAELEALLARALGGAKRDEDTQEMAVVAQGIARAAEILASRFTLVATNVPYVGRGKQELRLKTYCERSHPAAKADLATCFVERCLDFCTPGGSAALVTPQNWLSQTAYKNLRKRLLERDEWNVVAWIGEHGFESSQAAGAFTALSVLSARRAASGHAFAGLDASEPAAPEEKRIVLLSGALADAGQAGQLTNPEWKVVLRQLDVALQLSRLARSFQGVKTGDDERLTRRIWEVPHATTRWRFYQGSVDSTRLYGGMSYLVDWQRDGALLGRRQGVGAWGRLGVMVSQMRSLPVSLYLGEVFDSNASPIVFAKERDLAPLWCFCSSESYSDAVRAVDRALKPTNASLVQVPFDSGHWQRIAAEKYPDGLPKPHSDDPTQWLFSGHPRGAERPLQVAAARLVGHSWPRQTGSSLPDCPALEADGLEAFADGDGIVCLAPLRGGRPAAERLRALLAAAYGEAWSPDALAEALACEGSPGVDLEAWMRDEFFAQHCALFHQRPFVWQIWDGASNGFSALVNYHSLAAPNGDGRRTFEKLIYSYLGDWIERQRDEQKREVAGADARLASAEHLKRELEKILAGEPPYDLFVRWKPLHEQPIGWEPDLDDGVRINIRPFMTARPLGARARNACILRSTPNIRWDKDRGNEPSRPREDFPWFWSWDESDRPDFAGGERFDRKRWNGLHYTTAAKRAARERKRQGGTR